MPHSLESESPSVPVKDEPMDDAEPTNNADLEMTIDGGADKDETTTTTVPKEKIKLQDLFDDDGDSDEEFPSSAPAQHALSSPKSPKEEEHVPTHVTQMKASDPEVMRSFYQRLFPWRYLFQWLNHSPVPTNDFKHREFAYTLNGIQGEIYARYQSFTTSEMIRSDVIKKMPSRFEIGPVYTTVPRDRKMLRNAAAFKPLSKELCFDIDLTDYDDVRTCCDKANICNKCWQFMTMAIKVLDTALREDLGFKHIMWVYSGRRGVHAWVCDKRVRSMDDQRRRAVAGYLEVVKGGAQSGKKVNLRRPLHPHLARSLDILRSHFQEDVLAVQDPWRTEEQAEKLLQLLPDRTLNDSLRKKWQASPGRSSTSKWSDIDTVAQTGASKSLDAKALLEAKQDIVLEYTYPRLDIEVSKKLNHLLKSPFVVHPGTGRVCVPIDTNRLEEFDPLEVPKVQSLLAEIDEWKESKAEDADGEDVKQRGEGDTGVPSKSVPDWEKTSLRPYIEHFRTFVHGILKEEGTAQVKREREEDAMEF